MKRPYLMNSKIIPHNSKDGVHLIPFAVHPSILIIPWSKKLLTPNIQFGPSALNFLERPLAIIKIHNKIRMSRSRLLKTCRIIKNAVKSFCFHLNGLNLWGLKRGMCYLHFRWLPLSSSFMKIKYNQNFSRRWNTINNTVEN